MRKAPAFLAAGAVILAAAAPTARFVVLPALQQVPANLSLTEQYSGSANLLNSPALASGDMAHAFLTNVPVTGTQHVKVTGTAGGTAVMSNAITVAGPDKKTLLAATHAFAVDRVSLDAVATPAGMKAEPHQGLAVGFPLQPARTDYPFWDTSTQTATPAHYTRTETIDGRTAYVYTVHAAGPVKDPGTLAALPPVLPKPTLTHLVPTLPSERQQAVTALLPTQPALVPLSYDATTDTTAWVDSATGYLLKLQQVQTVQADLTGPSGPVPLLPVLHLQLGTTDGSVSTNAGNAKGIDTALTVIGTITPAALAALALLLAGLALRSIRRGRRSEAPQEAVEPVLETATED
jgi:hypothetical protein